MYMHIYIYNTHLHLFHHIPSDFIRFPFHSVDSWTFHWCHLSSTQMLLAPGKAQLVGCSATPKDRLGDCPPCHSYGNMRGIKVCIQCYDNDMYII